MSNAILTTNFFLLKIISAHSAHYAETGGIANWSGAESVATAYMVGGVLTQAVPGLQTLG